jgi:PhoH-like ATPase
MKQILLPDETVFSCDYLALQYNYGGRQLVLTLAVLEAISQNRHKSGASGRNSREFFSLFRRLKTEGFISTELASSAPIIVYVPQSSPGPGADAKQLHSSGHPGIITTAQEFAKNRYDVVLSTRNSILYMRAEAVSLRVSYFQPRKFCAEDLYPGYTELRVEEEQVSKIQNREPLALSTSFYPNEYSKLTGENDGTAYCRYDTDCNALVPLVTASSRIPEWLTPRNIEQSFALDALLNDDISLVSLIGKAGTGKTLLALAAGLYKSLDCDVYDKVLVSRPTLPLGNDIGYLPGSVEEKLGPWMHPISDNVDHLLRNRRVGRTNLRNFADLVEMGFIMAEPLNFIRGRSIHNQFLLVDEAQNLTLHEIRTILTRAGEGTKIVLAGDPYQIDNPQLTSITSGLMQVVEKFRDTSAAAHITLTRGERSTLSQLAADLL